MDLYFSDQIIDDELPFLDKVEREVFEKSDKLELYNNASKKNTKNTRFFYYSCSF